jgi:hypothetical protein
MFLILCVIFNMCVMCVQLTICQHILTRHDELRERARQLLEQARRDAATRCNNSQVTAQSPVKVRSA